MFQPAPDEPYVEPVIDIAGQKLAKQTMQPSMMRFASASHEQVSPLGD